MDDREWQARRNRTEQYTDDQYYRRKADKIEEARRQWERGSDIKAQAERLRGQTSFELESMKAEDRLAVMGREYEIGELVRNNNLRRRCVEAAIDMRLLEHETDEQIRLENNRHSNAKDYKTHETDEFIRLKKAFGQLTQEEQMKFFTQFESELKAKTDPDGH